MLIDLQQGRLDNEALQILLMLCHTEENTITSLDSNYRGNRCKFAKQYKQEGKDSYL